MELVSEEKIWYAYQVEVFDKLPNLSKKEIPLKLMKRIRKRWVSVEDMLIWLNAKEQNANSEDAPIFRELRKEIEELLFKSLKDSAPPSNANQATTKGKE